MKKHWGSVAQGLCVLGSVTRSVCRPGNWHLLLFSIVQRRLGRFRHRPVVHPGHACARKPICLGGCVGVIRLCACVSVSSHLWPLATACTGLGSASVRGCDWIVCRAFACVPLPSPLCGACVVPRRHMCTHSRGRVGGSICETGRFVTLRDGAWSGGGAFSSRWA